MSSERRGLDEYDLLAKVVAFFVLALVVWFFADAMLKVKTAPEDAKVKAVKERQAKFCGQIVKTCDVQTSSTARCADLAAKGKLAELLADPLSMEECARVEKELRESCPSDCTYAPSSLLVIPGKPKVESAEILDEKGMCSLTASKSVTLQGECRR